MEVAEKLSSTPAALVVRGVSLGSTLAFPRGAVPEAAALPQGEVREPEAPSPMPSHPMPPS